MKNGCSFSIFNFPLKMENGNNGMYTDPSDRVEELEGYVRRKGLTYLS